MKLRRQAEGLGVPVKVATANLPKDTLVKITGNSTVDKAVANDHAIGRLVVPSKTANGDGTVEVSYKEHFEIKASGNLSAGQFWKMGAADGTTGENTAVQFVPGTDAEERKCGIVLVGASSGGTAEVLAF